MISLRVFLKASAITSLLGASNQTCLVPSPKSLKAKRTPDFLSSSVNFLRLTSAS